MIQQLWLKQIRNIAEARLSLESSEHCYIYGDNNQGKTSVLEAISLAVTKSSPIQSDLSKVIQKTATECIIGVDYTGDELRRVYVKYNADGSFSEQVNQGDSKEKPFQTMLLSYISADALHIFQKDPDFRRKQLDRFCKSYFPEYAALLKQYEGVLRQKNRYLKGDEKDSSLLTVFNKQLSEIGSQLVGYRKQALELVSQRLEHELSSFSGALSEPVTLAYELKRVSINEEESLEAALFRTFTADREKEQILGYSLSGPQRDDFSVSIADQRIFDHYSRGINRIVAVLIQKSFIVLAANDCKSVIFLLDDTFAEVDSVNKALLIKGMTKQGQVFYSTTEKADISCFENAAVFCIKSGVINHG